MYAAPAAAATTVLAAMDSSCLVLWSTPAGCVEEMRAHALDVMVCFSQMQLTICAANVAERMQIWTAVANVLALLR